MGRTWITEFAKMIFMGTRKEDFSGGEGQPLPPFELPEALKEFFRQTGADEYVMVTNASDQGTLFVVKAPELDIAGMRGNIPMRVTHELYREPEAPVIRTMVKIYDDPAQPLALETFTNIRDEEQRRNFDTFSDQPRYIFTFYNQHLQYRLTKLMENTHREHTASLFRQALLVSSHIPDQRFNFDLAKAAVIRRTSM